MQTRSSRKWNAEWQLSGLRRSILAKNIFARRFCAHFLSQQNATINWSNRPWWQLFAIKKLRTWQPTSQTIIKQKNRPSHFFVTINLSFSLRNSKKSNRFSARSLKILSYLQKHRSNAQLKHAVWSSILFLVELHSRFIVESLFFMKIIEKKTVMVTAWCVCLKNCKFPCGRT